MRNSDEISDKQRDKTIKTPGKKKIKYFGEKSNTCAKK